MDYCESDSPGFGSLVYDPVQIDTPADDWPRNSIGGGDLAVTGCYLGECQTVVYHTIRSS